MNKLLSKALLVAGVFACALTFAKPVTVSADNQPLKYTKETIDKSETFSNKCTIIDRQSYEKIVVEGDTPAIRKINKVLSNACDAVIDKVNHEFAEEDSKNEYRSDEEYLNVYNSKVMYNKNGVFSVVVNFQWFQGGVYNYGLYCYNFDINTGKQLKLNKVTGLSYAKLKKVLRSKLLKKYDAEIFSEGALDTLSPKKAGFYIKGKKAYVVFNQYQIAYGYAGVQTVAVKHQLNK